VAVLTASGCKPGDYNYTTDVRLREHTPEEAAAADAIRAEADKTWKANQIEFDKAQAQLETYRQTAPSIVLAKSQAEIDTIHADNTGKLETIRADAASKVAAANAQAQTITALGLSLSVVLAGFGLGVLISIPILVVAGTLYLGALLAVAIGQIKMKSRVVTVTAYINQVRVDYFFMQDEAGRWHVQNPMDDERSLMANPKAISHMRPHLLQAAQVQWQRQQQEMEKDGLVVRVWGMLFGRRRKRAPAQEIIPATRSDKLEINL